MRRGINVPTIHILMVPYFSFTYSVNHTSSHSLMTATECNCSFQKVKDKSEGPALRHTPNGITMTTAGNASSAPSRGRQHRPQARPSPHHNNSSRRATQDNCLIVARAPIGADAPSRPGGGAQRGSGTIHAPTVRPGRRGAAAEQKASGPLVHKSAARAGLRPRAGR